MKNDSTQGNSIIFLGTGGARFMIISQILASGGMWLNLDGTQLLVDPGPGCIVQATKRKLRAEQLSAIILSHRHLDHSADTNIMVEAMTQGGHKRRGWLFAPADALGDEPIVYSFLRDRLDGVELLEARKSYSVGNITFTTPVRHIHPVESYGMVFKAGGHTLAYVTDTRYFDGLAEHYTSELMIINVVFMQPMSPLEHPDMPLDHLSVPEVEQLISEARPKVAILTHFGMGVWRGKPWEIARELSEKTGVNVIAARDGMRFDLARLDED